MHSLVSSQRCKGGRGGGGGEYIMPYKLPTHIQKRFQLQPNKHDAAMFPLCCFSNGQVWTHTIQAPSDTTISLVCVTWRFRQLPRGTIVLSRSLHIHHAVAGQGQPSIDALLSSNIAPPEGA